MINFVYCTHILADNGTYAPVLAKVLHKRAGRCMPVVYKSNNVQFMTVC